MRRNYAAKVEDVAPQLLLYSELVKPMADGRPIKLEFAVLTKTHHAAIDGVSGAELTAVINDLTPDAPPPPVPDGPPPGLATPPVAGLRSSWECPWWR